MNRMPSTAATSPPPQAWASRDVGLGSDEHRVGGGVVLRAQVVLVDVARAGTRLSAGASAAIGV